MRLPTAVAVVIFCILCVLTFSTDGMTRRLDSEFVYFPEQVAYIQLAAKCSDSMILWPANRRCYREGEQGPCNFGRVLAFDAKLVKPFCKEEILE